MDTSRATSSSRELSQNVSSNNRFSIQWRRKPGRAEKVVWGYVGSCVVCIGLPQTGSSGLLPESCELEDSAQYLSCSCSAPFYTTLSFPSWFGNFLSISTTNIPVRYPSHLDRPLSLHLTSCRTVSGEDLHSRGSSAGAGSCLCAAMKRASVLPFSLAFCSCQDILMDLRCYNIFYWCYSTEKPGAFWKMQMLV